MASMDHYLVRRAGTFVVSREQVLSKNMRLSPANGFDGCMPETGEWLDLRNGTEMRYGVPMSLRLV